MLLFHLTIRRLATHLIQILMRSLRESLSVPDFARVLRKTNQRGGEGEGEGEGDTVLRRARLIHRALIFAKSTCN